MFDSYTLQRSISIISSVEGLVLQYSSDSLMNPNYLTIEQSTGYANVQFFFSYLGTTYAGSHAQVVFWPGDNANKKCGPFLLAMNYRMNISGSQLQYGYQAVGTYKALFLVQNPISFKFFTLNFTVINEVYMK
jgi:hypothetical protein